MTTESVREMTTYELLRRISSIYNQIESLNSCGMYQGKGADMSNLIHDKESIRRELDRRQQTECGKNAEFEAQIARPRIHSEIPGH